MPCPLAAAIKIHDGCLTVAATLLKRQGGMFRFRRVIDTQRDAVTALHVCKPSNPTMTGVSPLFKIVTPTPWPRQGRQHLGKIPLACQLAAIPTKSLSSGAAKRVRLTPDRYRNSAQLHSGDEIVRQF